MSDDVDNWLAEREKEYPADSWDMLRPGQRIDAYKIVRQLGVGGMGQVYEAVHVALGVRRALKVFSTESEHSEFLRKRFVAEGRILADLQHPRIVRVYDLVVDEDSGMAYFEMDLVLSPDGQSRTLADELQDGADEEKIAGWFKDICEGLAYIHSQGVVHRDISLDNILIGRDGRAVITDFGIAKIIDDSYRKKIDVTVTMVYKDGSEVRIGKERYMAPELKKPNGRASFATDAWALGVLLFRMLSGSWYDVGTRLEDWHADLKYDWHPVLLRLFNPEPKSRLGNGGIASIPMLLHHVDIERRVEYKKDLVCLFMADKSTGRTLVTIVKARKARGDFAIPAEIDGCSVSSIGELAFADCEKLTSVTIPIGVRSIGIMAFSGCYRIKSVAIPDSVTSIGEKAFLGCSGLTSVTIPYSVVSIGHGAFDGCVGLKDVAVSQCVCSISLASVFPSSCHSIMRVTMLDGVTSIGDGSFSDCLWLSNMTIPDGVTTIGEFAFRGCSGLKSVTIGKDVTRIGDGAFSGCASLASIRIPDSVTSIGESVFSGCSSLKSVVIGNGVTAIGESAFAGCKALERIVIPDSVTSIGGSAFADCAELISVTIPSGVISIGSMAFSGCIRLESMTIPGSVMSMGGRVFAGCSGLLSVIMLGNAPLCDDGCFDGCNSNFAICVWQHSVGWKENLLASYNGVHVEFMTHMMATDTGEVFSARAYMGSPAVVKEVIGDVAWTYCIVAGSAVICGISVNTSGDLVVPSVLGGCPVTSIWHMAFIGCKKITSVTIPDGVIRIGAAAFKSCTSLNKVIIPSGITSIGDSIFYDCKNLTCVTIPDGVTSIGDRAFHGCHCLASITIPDGVTSIGAFAFCDCNRLTSVKIPDSVKRIETHAFSQCSSLTTVTISSGVTWVDNYAFPGCRKLSEFIVADDNPVFKSLSGLLLAAENGEEYLVAGVNGDVTIPNGVTVILEGAFLGYSGLTSVTIPDTVTSIGDGAFGCSGLTTVSIGNGVTSIGERAFDCCFGLKSVSVPVGHADRIKGLFLDSGHKIDSIEFVERKADEK